MTATDLAERGGYTVPVAGPSLRSRLWRLRFWLFVAFALVAIIILAIVRDNPTSSATMSTRNPYPDGAMATAEILGRQGVRVREIAHLSRAMIRDPETTTLAITFPSMLSGYQIDSILDYPGDVVFIGVSRDLLQSLTAGLEEYSGWDEELRDADCPDADAIAAERITAIDPRAISLSSEYATVCFANDDGYGTYVALSRDNRRIRLITDPVIAMNENLAKEGNAALVFRTLGANANLVWYTAAFDDTTTLTYSGSPKEPAPDHVTVQPGFLPAGSGDALFALGLAGLVAALWRGRRMGPLLGEPLPIVVHASESARGRGRLYRRARAYGRASAALRAATAERMGRRLGVPRTAEASALVAAVSRTSHLNAARIEWLLYGPPPASERAMMDLANELDSLEREVQRP